MEHGYSSRKADSRLRFTGSKENIMLTAICTCKARIYIDQQTGQKFNSPSAEDLHKCGGSSQSVDNQQKCEGKIPLYVNYIIENKRRVDLGFSVRRRDDQIAADIVKEALCLGLDPYNVRTKRQGDYLIILS